MVQLFQRFFIKYIRKGLRNPHCMKVPNVKMPRYYHANFHHKKVFFDFTLPSSRHPSQMLMYRAFEAREGE